MTSDGVRFGYVVTGSFEGLSADTRIYGVGKGWDRYLVYKVILGPLLGRNLFIFLFIIST